MAKGSFYIKVGWHPDTLASLTDWQGQKMGIERQGLEEVKLAKMGQTLGQRTDSPRDAVYMRVRYIRDRGRNGSNA
jgi:hypothetical protein